MNAIATPFGPTATPTMWPEPDRAEWTVVVPIRGTSTSKSRLVVDGVASSELAIAFGLDVIAACRGARSVTRTVVTTASPYLAAAAAALGAATVIDDAAADLNSSISSAVRRVRALDPGANIAVIVGDVAMVTPADIDEALAAAAAHPRALVCDRQGVGTVLISARAGLAHHPRFGGVSRVSHRAWGYREIDIDPNSRLRHDLDTQVDLVEARARGLGAASSRLLADAGL